MANGVVVSSNSYEEVETVAPPSAKPPSMYHDYSGSVRSQDIFVEQIEKCRQKGQRHKIFFPGSDDFELERFDMWNYDQICVPCLILQPRSSAEVASCIRGYTFGVRRCLSENRRTGSNLGIPRLCVAGGRMSMASMKEGCIVLDLSVMRGVKVDKESSTVLVQGGARIQDVDRCTEEHGLMCVTGACQYLGVVGCILGGGYGYTSRKYGLACDNVLSAQVVLADGTVKRCSPKKNEDIFWSLCGGGGGIGVVISITLRCYPLVNVALVKCSLSAPGSKARQSAIKEWANWLNGEYPVPENVYSQLVLPCKATSLPCIASSIDPEVIPQSEAYLELYRDMAKTWLSRPGIIHRKQSDDRLPISWDRVPGLCNLREGKLKARMKRGSEFQMLPYIDLQKTNDVFFKPGNVFVAYKYATSLTERIVEVLVRSTCGSGAINSESRIYISSLGAAINDVGSNRVAHDSRDINYAIMVEGRWYDSKKERRDKQEKEKVVQWVHCVVNSLNLCEGIRSTAHPESMRDQVSKKSGSGRAKPGFYNFGPRNGSRLAEMKRKLDRRNVFSLTTRVSWNGDVTSPRLRRVASSSDSSRSSRGSPVDQALHETVPSFSSDDDHEDFEPRPSPIGDRKVPYDSDENFEMDGRESPNNLQIVGPNEFALEKRGQWADFDEEENADDLCSV